MKNASKTLCALLAGGGILLILFLMILLLMSPVSGTPQEDTAPLRQTEVHEPAEPVSLLVMGRDRASGLYDVLMLVRICREEGGVTVLQLPRDTYAAYTDASYRKLNGAPRALGADGFCRFLADVLGVPVDAYVAVSLDAFADAVDAVGGVEMTLQEPLSYDDPAAGLSIRLAAGKQVLDGKAAEQFVRYRAGYADGDLGRLDAQKQFLSALFATLKANMDAPTVLSLAAKLLPRTDTDLTLSEAMALYEAVSAVTEERVGFVTLPGTAAIGRQSGASYFVASASACDELLTTHFGASAGGFDAERLLRHKTNADFAALYDTYVPYRLSYADEYRRREGEFAKSD